ncbi:hypothetical protein BJX66DRAFT_282817 [Aspergillus keveii]|uniref:Uncharacterized protein n=1 Tax=Aspergillus keveii TaxID=714993 RepID=A0ABR4FWH6_9EURO
MIPGNGRVARAAPGKVQDIAGLPQAQFGSTVSSRDEFSVRPFPPLPVANLPAAYLATGPIRMCSSGSQAYRPTRNALLSKYTKVINQEDTGKCALAHSCNPGIAGRRPPFPQSSACVKRHMRQLPDGVSSLGITINFFVSRIPIPPSKR